MDDRTLMLERAGISLTPDEMEAWGPSFDYYIGALQKLRTLDLGGVEPGFVFRAAWDSEP